MMPTNEQRAHDLAVSNISVLYDIHKQNIESGRTSSEIPFDIYLEYKKLYEMFLESLEKDFN